MPASWIPERDEWLRVRPVGGAWRVALRSGISVVVPLLALVLAGRADLAPYASFGAFASLYGRQLSWFTRAQMQVSAGVALTLSCMTGVLVGIVDRWWVQALVGASVAAAGQVLAKAHHYHPPGPLFLIFAYGAISSAPHTAADLSRAAVVSGLSALFAVLVGLAGMSLHPAAMRRAWAETGWLRPTVVHNWQPAWMAIAVLGAAVIARLLQIGHPYWAMVAALAPLSAPHVTSQVVRGTHRAVGTLLGLVPAWLLLRLGLSSAETVLVVAALQVVTEMVVGSNYAVAMLFITPMALLVGEVGRHQTLDPLLFDRGAETLAGCLVAFAVTMTGHQLRMRRLRGRVG